MDLLRLFLRRAMRMQMLARLFKRTLAWVLAFFLFCGLQIQNPWLRYAPLLGAVAWLALRILSRRRPANERAVAILAVLSRNRVPLVIFLGMAGFLGFAQFLGEEKRVRHEAEEKAEQDRLAALAPRAIADAKRSLSALVGLLSQSQYQAAREELRSASGALNRISTLKTTPPEYDGLRGTLRQYDEVTSVAQLFEEGKALAGKGRYLDADDKLRTAAAGFDKLTAGAVTTDLTRLRADIMSASADIEDEVAAERRAREEQRARERREAEKKAVELAQEQAVQAQQAQDAQTNDALREAQEVANDQNSCGVPKLVAAAYVRLRQIDKTAKQLPKAKLVARRLEQCRIGISRALVEGTMIWMTQERRAEAQRVETHWLNSGMDVRVTVAGRNAETMTMSYVLINRVWVHQMQQQRELFVKWQELGFRKVKMTDGFSRSWSFDLTPPAIVDAVQASLEQQGLGQPLVL